MRVPRAFYQIPPDTRTKVRDVIRKIEEAGGSVTVVRTRKAGANVNQIHLADLVRWYKQGNLPDLNGDWTETKSLPVDLQDAIDAATTFEDFGNLAKAFARQLMRGSITAAQATAGKGLILEMRQALKEGEERNTEDLEDTLVPVSEATAELARQFEGIIDEEAQEEIRALVEKRFQEDLVKNANKDGI